MTVLAADHVDLPGPAHAVRGVQVTYQPWTQRLFTTVAAANIVALALILIGWYQGSGELTVGAEISWLNLGLTGIGLSMAANGLWLTSARRSIAISRREILPLPRPGTPWNMAIDDEPPVVGAGMTRYHRPTCVLVAGKTTTSAPATTFDQQGLAPCPTCRP
jgi:hypothetical protein